MLRNVTGLLIRINVVIFILWLFANTNFMLNNFLVSSETLLDGRIWTLLTSVFSHNMPFHLLINMFLLYGFGGVVELVLGSKRFLIFYLMAGLLGSIGHCLASTFLLDNPNLLALGASGAISGVLVLFSLMFPTQLVFIFGLLPMPAILATSLFVGADILGLIGQSHGSNMPIGYGAHLGGALTGLIYYLIKMRPTIRSGRRDFIRV